MISKDSENRISLMLSSGLSVAEVCRAQKVSRSAVYRVRDRPRGTRRLAKNEGRQWDRIHSAVGSATLVELIRVSFDIIDLHLLGIINNTLFDRLASRACEVLGYTPGDER